ncbi:NADH-quinone oxidoreductase subunit J [Acidocella sp.]|uniref:NADH-quinone oxidoreductase subunit J n=1 Tax=Acidocella sp. TaxID=50710 RepID=UPI0026191DDC|nr:NADH-quinone oxidoreductase subunit J [Acidocella sp.]
MIVQLVFALVSLVLLASAVTVVSARNPVHAVLFLILAFVSASVLFLLAGAEFLAFILAIVYVGAVAVLFLFVVMMLDVDFAALKEGFQRYAPVGALVGVVLFGELGLVALTWHSVAGAQAAIAYPMPAGTTNAVALGSLLYTSYLPLFQLSGVILLVAMIGAIVLTHRDRPRAKRQSLGRQHARQPDNTLHLVKAELGAGAAIPAAKTQKETL